MTDTWQDGKDNHVPMLFLAGPVKHWWTCWHSDKHLEYLDHRDRIRRILVKHGYLTYCPWTAWQGSWDKRAQLVNSLAIMACDGFLWLTPRGIPDVETQQERRMAEAAGKPVLHVLPAKLLGLQAFDLLESLQQAIGPGLPYE